ncbi:sodium/chloride-dependent transporter [Lachnospiraceae bacterium TWA4]|nr:sodium/chloride-dependent transporter [Lachnospiraceae bacterium TWA4]
MEKREGFKSRLGFILVSAGCAIGIGNVWKFPYVAGKNGGAIFVLLYLLFLVLMGIPVMTMELAVGRGSGKSAVLGYKALEKPGSKWHIHGWICILGCYLLMMYYTTVAGWMVSYAWKFISGAFEGVTHDEVANVFGNMLASPKEMVFFMAVVVVLGFIVLSFGVQSGLEKVNKFMMIGLLSLIVVLAVHSVLLPGSKEGLAFYLLPNLNATLEIGLVNVIVAAMNQAFFTLSLGIAALEIFGSYMSKDQTLGGEAVQIAALDTFVALLSGLIIFPACFSFNVSPDQGPSLIFVTLPQVFIHMPGGRIWGTLFFVFMTFASFSTVTAVFENLIASSVDNFGLSRKKSVAVNFVIMLVTSLPCALGYNILSNVHLIGARDILDSEDFIVSNLLLPGGSLIFLLFCVTKFGWGFDKYLEEVNTGSGLKMPKWLKPYFQYILPVLILVILISGLI